jgi:hypothetical protein
MSGAKLKDIAELIPIAQDGFMVTWLNGYKIFYVRWLTYFSSAGLLYNQYRKIF